MIQLLLADTGQVSTFVWLYGKESMTYLVCMKVYIYIYICVYVCICMCVCMGCFVPFLFHVICPCEPVDFSSNVILVHVNSLG